MAKQTIAKAWKKPSASMQEVEDQMTLKLIHKKMSSILNDTQPKFLKTRQTWLNYALPSLDPTNLTLF